MNISKNKKLNLFFTIIIISLLSITFISCNDNDATDSEATSFALNKTNDNINPENPFNYFGEEHNMFVNEIGLAMKSDMDNLSTKKEITKNELNQISEKSLDVASNIISKHINGNISPKVIKDSSINLICDININESKKLCQQIKNAILNSKNDANLLISNIYEIENELLEDYKNGDSTKLNDLFAVTILKYSMIYWKDAIYNELNPYHNYITAMYIKKTVNFLNDKNLFENAINSIYNAVSTVSNWIVGHVGNIITSITYGASFDCAASAIIPKWSSFGGPVGTVFGIGCAAGASICGFYYGWTNPWF